jgi:hypothetical protein
MNTVASVKIELTSTYVGQEKITLKNLQVVKSLSRETHYFTATVCFNGKTFNASNSGWGGANLYYGDANVIAEAQAYAATLPSGMASIDCDLDIVLGDAIDAHLQAKQIKAALRKALAFVLPTDGPIKTDNGMAWRRIKLAPTPANIARLVAKYPEAIVLNGLA